MERSSLEWSFLKLRRLDRIYRKTLLKEKMSYKSGGSLSKSKADAGSVSIGCSNLNNQKGNKTKTGKKLLSSEDMLLCSYLEKLNLCMENCGDDHVEQIRSTTNKILNLMKINDVSDKFNDVLPLLITVLKTTRDTETIRNIVQTLENRLVPKQGLKTCISTLLNHDVIGALLHSLCVLKQTSDKDGLMIDVYALLAKLGSKDPDFIAKLKKYDAVKLAVPLMKKNCIKLLMLRPLLVVIKFAAAGPSTSYLGRDGVLPVLLSLMNSLGKNQSATLKLVVELFAQLTKSKYNCREIIIQSGISSFLHQLGQWEKAEGFHRIRILRAVLTSLGNLAEFKMGRSNIIDADGFGQLYKFCHNLPLISDYDAIISLASNVIQKCLPRKWLPIEKSAGAVQFPLPGEPSSCNQSFAQGPLLTSRESSEDSDDESSTSSSDDDNEVGKCPDSKCSVCIKLKDLKISETNTYKQFYPELELLTAVNPSCTKEPINLKKQDSPPLPSKSLAPIHDASSSPHGSSGNQMFDDLQGILSCVSLLKSDTNSINIPPEKENVAECSVQSNSDKSPGGFDSSLENCQSLEDRQRICEFMKAFKFSSVYLENAQYTKHVVPFVKVAYSDMNAEKYVRQLEPLLTRDSVECRSMLLHNLDCLFGGETHGKVVYDYDALVAGHNKECSKDGLTNADNFKLGKSEESTASLKFESRFECGNLRKAIMIGSHQYELILNPDINSDHHHQWFYFEVSNMEAGVPYSFYIVNCEKSGSKFNFGMKPVMFSVREATLGRSYWVRCGSNISYYRNYYSCPPGVKSGAYHTAYFSITFQHPKDICYMAYHYPYPYTLLRTHLTKWSNLYDKTSVFYRQQTLCETLGGNEVPVLTITAKSTLNLDKRAVVFLTGRVHPGETNASWVMKGAIDFLLSDKPSAESLRENFIFKIVPMLNPDGVINGCHRCSLTAEDLNRCWLDPSGTLQPTIYHTKRLIQCLGKMGRLPLVFCDFHGHSRRKNVFLYGCNGSLSWLPEDRLKVTNENFELLPKILHHLAPSFTMNNCCFTVEKNRESTARITVWRQLGVKLSYTMESTYCGCDQGPYKDYHLGLPQYEEMGMKFCQVLLHVQAKLKNNGSSDFLRDVDLMDGNSMYNKTEQRRESTEDEEFEDEDPVP